MLHEKGSKNYQKNEKKILWNKVNHWNNFVMGGERRCWVEWKMKLCTSYNLFKELSLHRKKVFLRKWSWFVKCQWDKMVFGNSYCIKLNWNISRKTMNRLFSGFSIQVLFLRSNKYFFLIVKYSLIQFFQVFQ